MRYTKKSVGQCLPRDDPGAKKSVPRDKALSWQRRGVAGEMRFQGWAGAIGEEESVLADFRVGRV
jgi:hypothetical protein